MPLDAASTTEVARFVYRLDEADFVGLCFHFAVKFSGAEAAEDIAASGALGDTEGDKVVAAEGRLHVAGGGEVVEDGAPDGGAGRGGGEGPEGGERVLVGEAGPGAAGGRGRGGR